MATDNNIINLIHKFSTLHKNIDDLVLKLQMT